MRNDILVWLDEEVVELYEATQCGDRAVVLDEVVDVQFVARQVVLHGLTCDFAVANNAYLLSLEVCDSFNLTPACVREYADRKASYRALWGKNKPAEIAIAADILRRCDGHRLDPQGCDHDDDRAIQSREQVVAYLTDLPSLRVVCGRVEDFRCEPHVRLGRHHDPCEGGDVVVSGGR